jgi:hypothetical protein
MTNTTQTPSPNPRRDAVCEGYGLQVEPARYVVVSRAPFSAYDLILGYTDDIRLAIDTAAALRPVVPGETFHADIFGA